MKQFKSLTIKSFTLIEVLVVATIISLLAAGGLVSYSTITKNSLDARRKADLEQIRAALEMYRSNNTNSSYPASLSMTCGSSGSIVDGPNIYLSKIPTDPKCNAYTYYYNAVDSGGGACDGSSADPCVNYTLAAHLETVSTTCQTLSTQCGSSVSNCTYCLGPYGQK